MLNRLNKGMKKESWRDEEGLQREKENKMGIHYFPPPFLYQLFFVFSFSSPLNSSFQVLGMRMDLDLREEEGES